MKAIILAAGKATRLLPLTKDTPQCILKVGKKTILERQIECIKQAGIEDIIVVTGHLSEKVEELCNKIGIKTLFNPFYGVSGMTLTLWAAKEELKNGFIFLYSDVLFDFNIIDGLLENKGSICLAIKKNGLREEAEKVIEEDGIIKRVSKAKSEEENGEFIGIAKFSSSGACELIKVLDGIARKNIKAPFIAAIDGLINLGETVSAYNIGSASFVDIDFLKDLEKAEKEFS